MCFFSAKANCPKLSCENVLVSCLVTVPAQATFTFCIHSMINSKTQKWLGPSSEPMFSSTCFLSLLGSCCFLITELRLQRAKEHLHVWRFNTAKGKWKASHAVQNSCRPDQQSFMQWFLYFFPNAWYVENKLLPFSHERARTFTSFHPSNLIVSFCKLTNKHCVFPWKIILGSKIFALQVFDLELGALFGTRARMGLSAIMTYAGGAYIHTRKECLGWVKLSQAGELRGGTLEKNHIGWWFRVFFVSPLLGEMIQYD